MKYVKLGNTGLDVSPIALGCMTYGEPARGGQPWSLPEDVSRVRIKQALDAGINFFDTANVYSAGSSEEIVGRALTDFADRDDVVVATKVHGAMRPGRPNGGGLSRKAILAELDTPLASPGSGWTTSTSIKSTGWTAASRWRRSCRRWTTSYGPARSGTSAPPRCTRGSSARPCTCSGRTAGPGSCRCRTTTTCSTVRRSGRCCRSVRTRASA